MIEDRALERLLERARQAANEEAGPRPRTDAEHVRVFGWGWDDPDECDPAAWGPTEAV